jgi:hypothetical protein
MRLRQGRRSWLPYTLTMDLEILRVERPHFVGRGVAARSLPRR